jgi:hypothetical protein
VSYCDDENNDMDDCDSNYDKGENDEMILMMIRIMMIIKCFFECVHNMYLTLI